MIRGKCNLRALLFGLTAAISISIGSLNADPVPIIARVADWPPTYWQENGKWIGMDIDFYQALAKETGLAFQFQSLPWSRALEHIKTGECTVMTELSITAERQKFMHFLGPYNSEEMVLVVQREDANLPIRNLDQMVSHARAKGLQIGIERDAFYGEEFNARLEKEPAFRANFEFARTTLAEMMTEKRLFGFIDQKPIVRYKIRTTPGFKELIVHPFSVNKGPLYFGVTQKIDPQILRRLQQACTKLMSDGTFAAIEAKWKNE